MLATYRDIKVEYVPMCFRAQAKLKLTAKLLSQPLKSWD